MLKAAPAFCAVFLVSMDQDFAVPVSPETVTCRRQVFAQTPKVLLDLPVEHQRDGIAS